MGIEQPLQSAIDALRSASQILVFAGAGLSAESGLQTFRDQGGLWEGHRVEDVATPEGFKRDPVTVWRFYAERQKRLLEVKPNPGHLALAEMERIFPRFLLVTQNVDDLSERAGSQKIVKIHGDLLTVRCTHCGTEKRVEAYINPALLRQTDDLPVCGQCAGLLRPGVVWFGELLPEGLIERALLFATQSDALLVVGTSGFVSGGYGLAEAVLRAGGTVIELNPNQTHLSALAQVHVRQPSASALPAIVQSLRHS
ncbi:MAG: NAD-dependent deacylase [Armatimonadetes bacterium]|nr:NAD-dependent deacylase [Armatimonadota bacterium]